MQKRGSFLLVFLLLLSVVLFFSALSVKINADETDEGCCSYTGDKLCQQTYEGFCCAPFQDNSDEYEECVEKYFHKSASCSDLELCDSAEWGTCTNIEDPNFCRKVDYRAECLYRSDEDFKEATLPEDIEECRESCCVCEGNICFEAQGVIKTKKECEDLCSSINKEVDDEIFELGITNTEQCKEKCAPSTYLYGLVSDLYNQPISDAVIALSPSQSAKTGSGGNYRIENLASGTQRVTVSAQGYETITHDIDISSGENNKNFRLSSSEGTGDIRAEILDESTDEKISGALISIGTEFKYTNNRGEFELTDLEYGRYIILISKQGYAKKEISVSLEEKDKYLGEITLSHAETSNITGVVLNTVDERGISKATVTLSGDSISPKATSSLSDGSFTFLNIPIYEKDSEMKITASAEGYYSDPGTAEIILSPSQDINTEVYLTEMLPGCGYTQEEARPPENFKVLHVPGEEAAMLQWRSPCSTIVAFEIFKDNELIKVMDISTAPRSFIYKDEEVEWGEKYTYEINAVYQVGGEKRSEKVKESITLGDKACLGKYDEESGFYEFCVDNKLRKVCDEANEVVKVSYGYEDCSVLGDKTYCVGPDFSGKTFCKEMSACDPLNPESGPFGFFQDKEACYGSRDPDTGGYSNFCYFDYSSTVVDRCYPCDYSMSCYDYLSEEACSLDNCAAGESPCKWYDTYEEIGKGICYEEDYEKGDKCGLCSTTSGIFQNIGCTEEVCSVLGNCFPNEDDTGCLSCEEASCSDFTSADECGSIMIDPCYRINPSRDSCDIGVCNWDSTRNICIKDGNNDGIEDCSDELNKTRCLKDTKVPETSPPSEYIGLGSSNFDKDFYFTVDDKNAVNGRFYYYITSRQESCPPSPKLYSNPIGPDKKVRINFKDINDQINWYDASGNTREYYIKFYSVDSYENQESIKSKFFYADITPPDIDVSASKPVLEPGNSNISLNIESNEEIYCTDKLEAISPDITYTFSKLDSEELFKSKLLTFTGLQDSVYRYTLECKDSSGNSASLEKRDIVILADEFISIISPKKAVHEKSFKFELETEDFADCWLYNGEQELELMPHKGNDFKKHISSRQYSFNDNTFYNTYRARCLEADEGKYHEANIIFSVDNLPPVTKIISYDGFSYDNFSTDNWKGFFDKDVEIILRCEDSPESGFGCKIPSYYCYSNESLECAPEKKFDKTGTVGTEKISISDPGKLCYYSFDKGNNTEDKKCGQVFLERPLSIDLIFPEQGWHSYPIFDLRIETDRHTDHCGYASSTAFNLEEYISQEHKNLFSKTTGSLKEYFERNFPLPVLNREFYPDQPFTIHIKCKDTEGNINDDNDIKFQLGYDPSKPNITKAYATPTPGYNPEANTVDARWVYFIVQTDDETSCKYTRDPAISYENMEGSFDQDPENPVFNRENIVKVDLTQGDDLRSFVYKVICKNRADLLSDPVFIDFNTDFDAQGAISATVPSQPVSDNDINLTVITNKPAECQYREEEFSWGQGYNMSIFESGIVHRSVRKGLSEGNYSFYTLCRFVESGKYDSDSINFIVDRTAPLTQKITLTYTCSQTDISPRIKADGTGSGIAEYEYELWRDDLLFDSPISQGTFSAGTSKITGLDLELEKEYYLKIKAIDEAGNKETSFYRQDGNFEVLDPSEKLCEEDKAYPECEVEQKRIEDGEALTGIRVSIVCSDPNGHSETYGIASSLVQCPDNNKKNNYTGSFLIEEKDLPSYLCYRSCDDNGNCKDYTSTITEGDEDEDGIPDEDDKCPSTKKGAPVNEEGCSKEQIDTDGDRLPDYWELRYDSNECQLDPTDRDTDADGTEDGDEDCDSDGVVNYDEFMRGSDPLVKDNDDSDNDGVADYADKCPATPAGKKVDTATGCHDYDNDGMNDLWEVENSLDPEDPTDASQDLDNDKLTNLDEYIYYEETGRKIDPRNSDTDADSWDDKKEIDKGYNPVDPESHPAFSIISLIFLILGILLVLFGAAYIGYFLYLEKKQEEDMHEIRSEKIPGQRPKQVYPKKQQQKPSLKNIFQKTPEKHKSRMIKKLHEKKEKRKDLLGLFDIAGGSDDKKAETLKSLGKKVEKLRKEQGIKDITELTEESLTDKGAKKELKQELGVTDDEFKKLESLLNKTVSSDTKELSFEEKQKIRNIFLELSKINTDKDETLSKLRSLSEKKEKAPSSKKKTKKKSKKKSKR